MAIKLEPGMFMLVDTKASAGPAGEVNPYGRVLYEVLEVGLQRPVKGTDGKDAPEQDGVKVRMVAGTGPSARAGQVIMDFEARLNEDRKKGRLQIITGRQAEEYRKRFKTAPDVQVAPNHDAGMPKHGGTGVVEMGW